MASEILQRNPTSTGNRQVHTWSSWVKLNKNSSTSNTIYYCASSGSNEFKIQISNGRISTNDYSSGAYRYAYNTSRLLYDYGNWFHLMLAVDTTQTREDDRFKIYVNGVLYNGTYDTENTNGGQNYLTRANTPGNICTIGQNTAGGANYDANCQLTDVFMVDGQALTPDVFGFFKDGKGYQSSGTTQATDFRPGQWSPHSPRKIKTEIERKGGFGINGFYLPMNDSSNPGADFHCTPNSIIKLKGEDLPQPRNGAPTTSDAYVSQLRQEEGTLGFDGVVKFDGDGDYLSIADHPDLEFGSGDFTIECFLYPTGIPQGTYGAIFTKGYPLQSYFMSTNSISLYASTATSGSYNIVQNANATGTNSVPLSRWTHYALCRSGNTWKIFINGNELYSATHSGTIADSTQPFGIGDYSQTPGTYEFQGFISNFRVVKGTALYTSNFTAPTEPLTNVTNTKLLCCNSSTSATASTVTPGTITANGNASATRNELTGSISLAVPGISTATGANLVTNGTFDTNTTGWTSEQSATLSVDNGRLKVLTTNTNYGSAIQTVTGLTVGKRYTFQVDMIYGNASLVTAISGASPSINSGWQSADYVWRASFTATTTSLLIDLQMASQSNVYGFWDNVILKQEDAPRDYSADIKGSGTNKTPTLSGRSGVGYELGGYYGSAYTSSSNDDSLEFPGTSGDFNVGTGDFTVEMWLNPDSTQATNARLFGQDGNSAGNWDIYIAGTSISNQIRMIGGAIDLTGGNGSSFGNLVGDQWNHFCLERYDGQLTTYVNGVAVYTQSYTSSIGDNNPFRIGQIGSNVYGGITYGFNGEIQDFRFYKGVAKYKGGFDVPKPYTPVGIESWRQVSDICKNNFATLNPLYLFGNTNTSWSSNITLSNGSLTAAWTSGSGSNQHVRSNFAMLSGKWYFEGRMSATSGGDFGVAFEKHINDSVGWGSDQLGFSYRTDGQKQNNTSASSYGSSYVAGDIIGVAFDADAGSITFYKNGTSQGTAFSGISIDQPAYFAVGKANSGATLNASVNFGQNPTFSGTVTAGTYTDGNGKGLFKYQPPTGYLALCEDNLPTPAIADPGKHFKCVLYKGDGNGGHSITGVGFQPDLVWLKERTSTSSHQWHDSVRGAGNALISNVTNAESYSATYLYSLDSDGFTLGSSGGVNASNDDYVAWCWKAGGAAVSNKDGTITSQVSANQTAGFSIVSYSGDNTNANKTVGHGLNKTPKFIIVKPRTEARHWLIWHNSFDDYDDAMLFDTGAPAGLRFGPNAPTSDVFGVYGGQGNRGTTDFIAYCWAEVEGFSKFGSYYGNGNPNGPFVYCGFKPAWIMIKPYGSGNGCYSGGYTSWSIYDSSRSPANDTTMHQRVLFANRNYQEGKRGNGSSSGTFQNIDIVSNGFKIKGNSNCETNTTSINGFIFVAFAESPFQTANAK